MPIKRCPGFYCFFFLYRYGVRRSGYRRISWLSTWSQFRYLCVHFFVTFPLARYSIFSSALSLENTLFVFVTFRLAVQPFYDVCGIHDHGCPLKTGKGTDILPVVFPVTDRVWVLLSPIFHCLQLCQGLCLCRGIIDRFEIRGKFLGHCNSHT